MRRKITLVELTVYDRITPLASGYLKSYACRHPEVPENYEFQIYSTVATTAPSVILKDLERLGGDIFAFSCYVWNMRLVRHLVSNIAAARPDAYFVLGGPQVMHCGDQYLDPGSEQVIVCNGEGEITFAELLLNFLQLSPDLTKVKGITFRREGELITTEAQPRLQMLDEIPSPFLSGVLDGEYTIAMLETNRGCPFHCGFCYWGGATNDRVYRFDEERVKAEIEWMARRNTLFLYIADANWGMLRRDVEFSRHICHCKERYGFPNLVYFSAAKNSPEKVSEIVYEFSKARVIASQPVSMQTLSSESLARIERENIRLPLFNRVQDQLRASGINSFVELIWPLPGETLTSFKNGIEALCSSGAETIISYAHLLLHNTPLYRDREKYRFITRTAPGTANEAELVTGTAEVNESDFEAGLRFFYAVHMLHNTKSAAVLVRLLLSLGVTRAEFFSKFADFMVSNSENPFSRFFTASIRDAGYYDIFNYGKLVHLVLHLHRRESEMILRNFLSSQPWWELESVRVALEIDMINRPYVYSNTPMAVGIDRFQYLKVRQTGPRELTASIPEGHLNQIKGVVRITGECDPQHLEFKIDHKRLQYPLMKSQSLDHSYGYCHGMIEKVGNIMPMWTVPRGSQTQNEPSVVAR